VDGWQDYLRGIAGLLPAAWQFPESTCARITVNGEIFTTKQFSETAWRMESPVKVHGAQAGKVEVFYREERPPADEGPFTAEERRLIDIVAERWAASSSTCRLGKPWRRPAPTWNAA